MSVSRDEFLRNLKVGRRFTEVALPRSGVTVRVQSLTERERSRYEMHATAEDGRYDKFRNMASRRLLISMCVVDAEGKRLIGDSEDERDSIGDMDAEDAGILYGACRSHCGLDSVGEPAGASPTTSG